MEHLVYQCCLQILLCFKNVAFTIELMKRFIERISYLNVVVLVREVVIKDIFINIMTVMGILLTVVMKHVQRGVKNLNDNLL